MKILLICVIICLLIALVCYCVGYALNFIEMVYARACVLQTIDQIIKIVRYQQIILSDLGIPYKTQLNRHNFNTLILPIHKSIIKAYWDLDRGNVRISDSHYESLHASYVDNINAFNLLLEEYNVYNVRYMYARDKCVVLNNMFSTFPFLNEDIQYRLDNGIAGTGAFTK